MAANKFATMVHTNTNNITLILIYAVLEWTLILLLLLNSLFSFLIIKFSQFFALKPPCLWCSTLHRFLEPENSNSHRDLLCELHSKEVSILGFCPNHKKLAEIKELCEDCFSSHLDFQCQVKQSDGEDEDEQNLRCSCCGLKFHKKSFDSFVVTRSSCDVLEHTKSEALIKSSNDQVGSDLMEETLQIQSRKETQMNNDGKDMWDSNTFEIETELNQLEKKEDSTSDFLPQHLEFFFDHSGNQLVPIELVDSTTEESQNVSEADEDHASGDYEKALVIQNHQTTGLESMELKETENSLVLHAKNSELIYEKSAIVQEIQTLFIEELQENAVGTEKSDPDTHLVHEEAEVTIGTEITVLDLCVVEPLSISHDIHVIENGLESNKSNGNCNQIEEEKIPNTPHSTESLNQPNNNLLMIEAKESGAEESFDTVEKLKSALQALYAELEEERGASAVAASETMAMINRLQEEKAAMQMEALQYQRMMEEQSEYDQEALQLLNDLMVKREKELEFYRKKVAEYEAKERRLSQGSEKSGTGSDSCSHSEEGNGIPIDRNQESWNPDTHDAGFLDLESSLADFEEERLLIFEQVKVLEEKLFALSDEENQRIEDGTPIQDLDEENGKVYENGFETIGSPENGFHSDVIGIESEGKVITLNRFHSGELENRNIGKRSDFEEEVDQVYGRLQALEADREFLKHCIGSLKKGDKGMELLQEILQHLRDLRTMDLQ
ncbi:unnamed protein product [Lactuca virosa]|uniref:GTD-binding domain-containing protein n=1 Tax=Lactuca virosa TaxID=75947 RepID=A0AAU9LJA7_9ASTR|nr:unnamed protein product [Lactuca virosa]